jgi:hypothetical protein
MTTVDEIKQALDAIAKGDWEWHHSVTKNDQIVGYDGLRIWFQDGHEEDVLQWRKDAWIEISPPYAHVIEKAPAYLRHLLAELDRLRDALSEIENICSRDTSFEDNLITSIARMALEENKPIEGEK